MIAMAVIAVGLLAMWHLHVVGITSNAAGRRHTIATAMARELVSGLERLAFSDGLISSHTNYTAQGTPAGPPASALFGPLVAGDGTIRTGGGVYEWNDSTMAVPGVRLDSQMREQGDSAARYERRWTVWELLSPQPGAAGGTAGVKLIAVSVIWRDPPFARPREVVLYTQVANASSIVSGLVSSE
jgi:hypothetical protein